MELEARWLGRIDYRAAWQLQHELVAAGRRATCPTRCCCWSTTRCSPLAVMRTPPTCARATGSSEPGASRPSGSSAAAR
ncbi:MAG: hypothetical protein R3C32_00425 [Chloroflexota bacterium]